LRIPEISSHTQNIKEQSRESNRGVKIAINLLGAECPKKK